MERTQGLVEHGQVERMATENRAQLQQLPRALRPDANWTSIGGDWVGVAVRPYPDGTDGRGQRGRIRAEATSASLDSDSSHNVRCCSRKRPLVIVNEVGLRRVLASYVAYYMRSRTHLALAKDSPVPRSPRPVGLAGSDRSDAGSGRSASPLRSSRRAAIRVGTSVALLPSLRAPSTHRPTAPADASRLLPTLHMALAMS
jgi:hypothetical protein